MRFFLFMSMAVLALTINANSVETILKKEVTYLGENQESECKIQNDNYVRISLNGRLRSERPLSSSELAPKMRSTKLFLEV
jgi:hypothetical protein